MGQYQEWLQYQALDRKLRSQLKALETIQAQVQEQIQELRKQLPQADNPVLLALAYYLVQQQQAVELAANQGANPEHTSAPSQSQQVPEKLLAAAGIEAEPTYALKPQTMPESLSNALSNWGGLPNFDPQNVPATPSGRSQTPDTFKQGQRASQPVIAPLFSLPTGKTPVPGRASRQTTQELPEIHGKNGNSSEYNANANLEIPDWLQHITVSTEQGYMPIDPESVRTNRLVQRWLTRWGKQTPPPLKTSEDASHE